MIRKIFMKIAGFNPDKEIPVVILLSYCFEKFINLLRGILVFRKKFCFIGKHCVIKNKKKIHFDKYLNVADYVVIDALSKNGIYFGNKVSIGYRTRIECTGSFSHIGKGFKCGNNCGLGTDSFYGAAGGIEIGNNVIIGNYVSMHSENHNYSDSSIPIKDQGVNHKGICIGDNCWIGAKVTILDGSVIGSGTVIAAGAVVTGIFPDNVILGGVPAKIIRKRIE